MPEVAARPDALRRLDPLVGRWASSGEMVDPASGERTSIVGTDEYSWLDGGWFLVHRVDVVIGDAPVRALELIGERDPASDDLLCRAYDDRGTVSVMRATVAPDGTRRRCGASGAHDRPRRERDGGDLGASRPRRQLAALDGDAVRADHRGGIAMSRVAG